MAFLDIFDEGVPEPIRARVRTMLEEIDSIYTGAMAKFGTVVPNEVTFTTLGGLMTTDQEAQTVSFVIRFGHLREEMQVGVDLVNGEWHITNLWEMRHMLNDVRPIIQNQKDCTFYTKINGTIQQFLKRVDPTDGLCVRVFEDGSTNDVTAAYALYLGESKKAVAAILGGLDYAYLYNGILQHSDTDLSLRLISDYTSGELNYILLKHVRVLGQLHHWLTPYYDVLNSLSRPKLGSLIV